MNEIKDALLRMVKAARIANEMDGHLCRWGGDNPYRELYCLMFDAIYHLIGEHTDKMEESVTHKMLTAPFLDDERRAACLAHIYEVNHVTTPHTFEKDEMQENFRKNGGYETPEGDWT